MPATGRATRRTGRRRPGCRRSKSITFAEFGFPSCDRCTNQPNVFFDPKSSESFTPYLVGVGAGGRRLRSARVRDDLARPPRRSMRVEYWATDGRNDVVAGGVPMVEPTFMAAWNWDARPFPAFPALGGVGRRARTGRPAPGSPARASRSTRRWRTCAAGGRNAADLPDPAGQGWSVHYRPLFLTDVAAHATGRESRAGRIAAPLWSLELAFDALDGADAATLCGFYAAVRGAATGFLVPVPPELGAGPNLLCRFADDGIDLEEFARDLTTLGTLTLRSIRP